MKNDEAIGSDNDGDFSSTDSASVGITYSISAGEVYPTTREKLYRPLREYCDTLSDHYSALARHQEATAKNREWLTLLAIALTVVTTLVTSNFEDGRLPAWLMEKVYIGIAAITSFYALRKGVEYFKHRRENRETPAVPSIDGVIEDIIRAGQRNKDKGE